MRQQLKKITDLTINDILNKNIILPSTYFDKFNYHAKELEIDLDDEKFKHEINKLISEDFQAIENYMNLIATNAASLKENTKNAADAILNNDIDSLNDIYKKILNLELEVKSLNNKLFVDDITNTFNKKWIYKIFLNDNALFQQNGICILVDVIDHNYIQNEYGDLLANNLLIFATKFIKQKLKDEDFDYDMVRYSENKFIIFIQNLTEEKKDVVNFILNLEQLLSSTTLKSNSGLFIKAKYEFRICSFKINQDSKEIFENLLSKEKKRKI